MSTILGQCGEAGERCIRVGLVNNMPDAALGRTERQFRNLLGAAAHGAAIQFSLFSLDGIARNDAGRCHLETSGYLSTEHIASAELDAVVVTGTEPREPDFQDEPYWDAMVALFDWIAGARKPAIFSCLATHAAVFHFDGLLRRRLAQKRFGLFDHVRACKHELTANMNPVVRVAHSRCNELASDDLEKSNYRVLTMSPDAGADLFVKQGRNSWLFCQGHPEYDADALGREYQRDVRRFLAGDRETYPALPVNYFRESEADLLTHFQRRALAKRSDSLMAEFPTTSHAPAVAPQLPADGAFGAWLANIVDEKYGAGARKIVPARRAACRTANADNAVQVRHRMPLRVARG
jgi:homoserine O-succinyltransferase